MRKYKLKVGDKVIVVSGDHKGETGNVISFDRNKDRVFVKGVNLVSKHEKPSSKNPKGGVFRKEAPVHISNVSLLDSSGAPSRCGYEVKNDVKVRVLKKSKEVV